jgi:putative endonuclease
MPSFIWIVYILRCADDTLYTGITNNLDRRMVMHYEGKGAKYTRGRGPFEIIYCEEHATRSAALKREAALKKLSRSDKISLRNR